MAGRHRGKSATPREVVAVRAARAWELRLRGETQASIAATLGVDPSRVSRYLSKRLAAIDAQTTETVERYRWEQVAILENLVSQAYQAWADSRRDGKPDSRFLAAIRGGLADIRGLLGLDAPLRVERIDAAPVDPLVLDAIVDSYRATRAAASGTPS